MAERTTIEWCDATWNPIRGCSSVGEGCRNCWARGFAHRQEHLLAGFATAKDWTGKVELIESALEIPLRWRKPRRIGVALMGDLFHENLRHDSRVAVFDAMREAQQHTYMLLTKRYRGMAEFCQWWVMQAVEQMPSNWWFGASAWDQPSADEACRWLLRTPAACRWLSLEPLLGEVDLAQAGAFIQDYEGDPSVPGGQHFFPHALIDWAVVGGETGPGARPMHPDWARKVRDQCVAAGIPFFFKQSGAWVDYLDVGATGWDFTRERRGKRYGKLTGGPLEGREFETRYPFRHGCGPGPCMVRVGKKAAGRLLDGREWNELPEVI